MITINRKPGKAPHEAGIGYGFPGLQRPLRASARCSCRDADLSVLIRALVQSGNAVLQARSSGLPKIHPERWLTPRHHYLGQGHPKRNSGPPTSSVIPHEKTMTGTSHQRAWHDNLLVILSLLKRLIQLVATESGMRHPHPRFRP